MTEREIGKILDVTYTQTHEWLFFIQIDIPLVLFLEADMVPS